MRSRNVLTLVLALLAPILLVDVAQAYYTPGLGRFLNRDPYFERGGINLYAYVKNRVTFRIDPFGLKTYVIEGTWSGDGSPNGPCNAQRFGEDDPEGAFNVDGPQGWLGGGFGAGVAERVNRVVSEICKDMWNI